MYSKQERRDKFYRYKEIKEWDDPYIYWPFNFSPAESMFWHHCRCRWIVVYPEFPVLSYFVDFANPFHKLWIEIDGKEWHKDKEKDDKRQKEIENEWWKIIRITWTEVYHADKEPIYEQFLDEEEYMNLLIEYEGKNSRYLWILNELEILSPRRENNWFEVLSELLEKRNYLNSLPSKKNPLYSMLY